MKKITAYILFPVIALGVGGLSALLTREGMENTYTEVIKPPLSPPAMLFPIVWSILFVLMGIGMARVWQNKEVDPFPALVIWITQLAVNFAWGPIFFNMQAYLFAFFWLLLLWVLILIMIGIFRRSDKIAAYLQIPYLLWVTFAGYLNLAIYFLNR